MQLTRLMVPASKYNIKCPYAMTPEGIAVHNTANKASAMAEGSYMVGNNNSVSFHYAIDDYRIVQCIEENRNAYHAGDGRNGRGNRKMISIEICHSTNPDAAVFDKAERLSAKFIAFKLKEKGWGIDKVYKHQDFSKKYCPHKTLDLGWERYLNLIRAELALLTAPTLNIVAHVKVTADELNIRSGPSVKNSKVAVAPKGGEYDVYEIQGDWGRINGGWFNLDYTTYNTTTPVVNNSANYTVKINTDSLNVRSDAGTTNKITGSVKKGEVYTIIEEKNGWGKLKSGEGWIKLSYTVKTTAATQTTKPASKNLSVGSKVKIKSSAKTYCGGKTIPSSVKGKTYTVKQIGTKLYPNGILLKEIMSWVNRSDLDY